MDIPHYEYLVRDFASTVAREIMVWLDELGTEGWDLVFVDKDRYFFKREIIITYEYRRTS
jgi:hypothetical protein